MRSLRYYSGNRLDVLAEAFSELTVRKPPASPFDSEIILVQSAGMERWLSLQLASKIGVCANCRFHFPNEFVQEISRAVIPEFPDGSAFEPAILAWRIMELLPACLDDQRFASLRSYLGSPVHGLKLLQLSERIAYVFDQYTVYRPELISGWEAGADDHWQAVLWRKLSIGHEGENRAVLGRMLLEKLGSAAAGELNLPERVSVFGISYLPPFHIQILQGLSRLTEVNLFLLNPCREYWGNILPEWRIGRMALEGGPSEDLHLESGNSLLASMGKLGRDFFELMTAIDCEEYTLYKESGENGLLSHIRADILNLRESREVTGSPLELPPSDRSVEIHSCHSPMREVEVLFDHLLEMFENIPNLTPGDIVVMAPDIEAYAPFIQAVFDTPGDESRRIPFNIADRSMRKESAVIDAYLAILDLWDERTTASRVLGILHSGPLRKKFEIADEDLELITKWVQDVRIKWGLDEEERRKWSPNAFRENTWVAGIERLLLGYALPGKGEKTFRGILPYDLLEGSETLVLGNLLSFLEALFGLKKSLDAPRRLSEWVRVLLEILTDFFVEDEDSRDEVQALRHAIGDIKRIEQFSGFSGELDMTVVRWYMSRFAEKESFGRGFLAGGVTFCSMLPMRSIPFKVVCLIGMNENAFPRQSKPLEFDLMAKDPKPGDRSQRNDDRYLFLEAIVSAQEKLYISYTGRNSRDNSLIPPSVLVSELMDYMRKNFTVEAGGERDDPFLTEHRLQPFNPAYFSGSRDLFSYSEERLAQARSLLGEKREPEDFITEGLPLPDESFRTVSAADLGRFLANPVKFLLNRRLGIFLDEESGALDDAECFEMGGLDRYCVADDLIGHAIAGIRPAEREEIVNASGVLPHGTPGRHTFGNLSKDIESFLKQAAPYVASERLEPLEIDLGLDEFRVTGAIESLYRERLVRYRFATIKPKDLLKIWVEHLLLNATDWKGYPKESILIGGGKGWEAFRFPPVANAPELIRQLLGLYWEGLSKPLHFFPESSLTYAQALEKGKTGEDARKAAEKKWMPGYNSPGEWDDLHLKYCFKTDPPLDEEFERISLMVYGPLLGCREKI